MQVGTTVTHERQAFAIDQTVVPGAPRFFSRSIVSSVTGVNNYAFKEQRIEDSTLFVNGNAVTTFWAKADTARTIAVEFMRTISMSVQSVYVEKIALTTVWTKYTISIPCGAITITGSNRGYVRLRFWFEAGSNFNSNTDSLGHQSGTFDIARVQLEEGVVATPYERRPYALELAMCQRYFEKSYKDDVVPGTANEWKGALTFMQQNAVGVGLVEVVQVHYQVRKFAEASLVIYNPSTGTVDSVRNIDVNANGSVASGPTNLPSGQQTGVKVFGNAAGSAVGNLIMAQWTAESEVI